VRAYWPASATPREPSLNQCGKLIPRDDDKLVRVPEELRETANRRAAELKIVSIPHDVQWVMTKTDGHEQVREVHRTWEGSGDDGQRETGSGGRARLRW
jgi:hypothetical protein